MLPVVPELTVNPYPCETVALVPPFATISDWRIRAMSVIDVAAERSRRVTSTSTVSITKENAPAVIAWSSSNVEVPPPTSEAF